MKVQTRATLEQTMMPLQPKTITWPIIIYIYIYIYILYIFVFEKGEVFHGKKKSDKQTLNKVTFM